MNFLEITKSDIDQINNIVLPVCGMVAKNVQMGIGTFVIMEFGKEVQISDSVKRGEWLLWLYFCEWFIENPDGTRVGSEDPRHILKKYVTIFEGQKLLHIKISPIAFETSFIFENGLVIHTYPNRFIEEHESWMLFTPGGKVLVLYPNGKWTHEKSG
jgi:hypothetical protein